MDHALNESYISDGDMSEDITGETLDCKNIVALFVQMIWTGTPVGNILLQGSVDGTLWTTLDTIAGGGAAGNSEKRYTDVAFRKFRVFWDDTSGTGTLNVKWSAKCII